MNQLLDRGIRYRHGMEILGKIEEYHGTIWNTVPLINSRGAVWDRDRFDYFNLDDKMIFKDHQPGV